MGETLMMTRKLAAFVAGLSYDDIPRATVEMSKRLLLDGIGCMLAGINSAPARNVAEMVRCLGGERQATILPGRTQGSVRDAAFVNGIALYSVGLNDVHSPSGAHPGACVIPTVLAVAEWKRLPGKQLLTAMVAGYEVNGRVGRAIIPTHRERGFHPTGTCGTFGATAAAARLFGFDAATTASALGIAGSQAAGLYECHHDGTSTMIFHAGRAAQNGVEAALLVQAGMTGPATVIEGTKGFFRATSNASDPDAAMRDLGQRYEIDATSFRPYFGCSSTISASGAMANIMRRAKINADDIDEIVVRCHPIVAQDNAETDPRTLLAARLSLPFNVALVIAYGDVLASDLEAHELDNPKIRALLPKIKLIADQIMPRRAAHLEIRFKDGHRETEAIEVPRGSAKNPLTWPDVVAKFKPLVSASISHDDQLNVIEAVANIEMMDGAGLVAVLRTAVKNKSEDLENREVAVAQGVSHA
jgi:2-methylcitrate dehydratase PrpD